MSTNLTIVTDRTCDFGLIGPECSRPYSTFNTINYHTARWIYFSIGLIGVLNGAFRYVDAVRKKSIQNEKNAYLATVFCSVTLIGRAIDPNSFGTMIPRIGNFLLAELCSASIYSVLVEAVFYWRSLILQSVQEKWRVLVVKQVLVLIIWIYYVGSDVVVLDTKGYYRVPKIYRYVVDSLLTTAILIFICIYGWQILQRVYEMDKIDHFGIDFTPVSSNAPERDPIVTIESNRSIRPPMEELSEAPFERFRKIKRVFYVIITCSVLTVTLQVFASVTLPEGNADINYVKCSTNGSTCKNLKANIPPLHVLQFIGILGIQWGYLRLRSLTDLLDKTFTLTHDKILVA
uniref:Uncharacterized protein AlNc14C160G7756 n=1 Tax=Albugo laibachii Nc14 TaxID=890382 RepID=F0WMS0_9STRA|nr:conserved hypothetical protein [Albugo laibachii Nc14]|eukprot:CCA22605.1 conserved hypothetical protein [Albugo laibachii Nc14]